MTAELVTPHELVEDMRRRFEERAALIWAKGTAASKEAYALDIERLEAIAELVRALSPSDLELVWPQLKRLFYDTLSCPYCAISARPVLASAQGIAAEEDDDEKPLRGPPGAAGGPFRIACAECPVGLLAVLRDYSHENGCHRMPEYKALKHAAGNKAKALQAVEACMAAMAGYREILTIRRSIHLGGTEGGM